MGLINLLPTSRLGLGGKKPPYQLLPNPPASHHLTYSIDGRPNINLLSTGMQNRIPLPSTLDEWDVNNKNKYKSPKTVGRTYLDNLPK